jgi:capsular polysaccharide biosynthesis protein
MTVAEVYRALWRRRYLIGLMTLALVVLVGIITSQETKQYKASVLVRVEQKGTTAADQFGSLQTGALLAGTYARIAETSSVADRVKAQLGPAVAASGIKISASQVSDLELLEISATNANPQLAARIANAVPAALTFLVKHGGSSPDVLTTVDRATPPSSPSSPNLKLNLALAFIIGLVLNGGVVLLAAAFADRINSAEDLERLTGLPVIATIPLLQLGSVADLAASRPGQIPVLANARRRAPPTANG